VERPGLLDVVRLDTPLDRWPAGTEGTVVETMGDHAIVEVEGETVLASYSALTIVWSATREHAF